MIFVNGIDASGTHFKKHTTASEPFFSSGGSGF
jgi:hypothetical protein